MLVYSAPESTPKPVTWLGRLRAAVLVMPRPFQLLPLRPVLIIEMTSALVVPLPMIMSLSLTSSAAVEALGPPAMLSVVSLLALVLVPLVVIETVPALTVRADARTRLTARLPAPALISALFVSWRFDTVSVL